MKLPKVTALKCESNFAEIAVFKTVQVLPPAVTDWAKLAFSITETTTVHPNAYEYPFIFSSGIFGKVKPIMSNDVATFRSYSLLMAATSAWTTASLAAFGTKPCMENLGKVYKYLKLLEESPGQLPDHPLVNKEVPDMILAIANVRAIEIMSSDEALSEQQAHRRFWMRCKIWGMLQPLTTDPFWGRFVRPLIAHQKRELAELFIKIVLKFSRWPDASHSDTMYEAKLLLPYTALPAAKQLQIADLARLHQGTRNAIGIAGNLAKNVPPQGEALLYVSIKEQTAEELFGTFDLEQVV